MTKFNIKNPRTVAGESTRAFLARMWNADRRCGVGGYVITAEHVSRIFEILGDDAADALRGAGFQPIRGGQWITRFRTKEGGEAYISLTPPWALLTSIARHFAPRSENNCVAA